MGRVLRGDWITNYVRYIEPITESPSVYHWWAAATILGASLKRYVWYDRGPESRIYPNLYTVLVGKPGLGKSLMCINPAIKLLNDAGTANILSDKLTIEYVLDRLSKGFPVTTVGSVVSKVSGGQVSAANPALKQAQAVAQQVLRLGTESASIISASELSVFLKNPEDALPILNQLWDSVPGKMQYGTRYKSLVEVTDACQSLLGGSAPQYLAKSIPNDAVGGGFTRRVNFVFSDSDPKVIYFPNGHGATGIQLRQDLIGDLQHIATTLRGEFSYTDKNAEQAFINLRDSCKADEFDDEATASYKMSKWVHAIKLALIMSASRSDSLCLSEQDIKDGEAKTAEVGKNIGRVFRGVGLSNAVQAADAILRFVETNGYATRGMIARACWKYVSNLDDLDRLLTLFTQASPPLLYEETLGNKVVYKPVPMPGTVKP